MSIITLGAITLGAVLVGLGAYNLGYVRGFEAASAVVKRSLDRLDRDYRTPRNGA